MTSVLDIEWTINLRTMDFVINCSISAAMTDITKHVLNVMCVAYYIIPADVVEILRREYLIFKKKMAEPH